MMIDDPTKPEAPIGPAAGEEPEEESGAGYGNHAPEGDENTSSEQEQEPH